MPSSKEEEADRQRLAPLMALLGQQGVPSRFVPGTGLVIRPEWAEPIKKWLDQLIGDSRRLAEIEERGYV